MGVDFDTTEIPESSFVGVALGLGGASNDAIVVVDMEGLRMFYESDQELITESAGKLRRLCRRKGRRRD